MQVLKENLHARVTGLPVCPELTREVLPRTSDIGAYLSVTGMNYIIFILFLTWQIVIERSQL